MTRQAGSVSLSACRTSMKKLLLLSALLLPGVAAAETTPATLPEIVARINDVAVTRAQFETRLTQSRAMNPALFDAMGAEEKAHAVVRVLNGMIQRELEVQEAHRRKMAVPETEVEWALAELETVYSNKGGLKQALTDFNITLEQWKEETRRNLLIERLEASLYRGISASEEEVRQEFIRNFWKEKQPPSSKDFDEHREHMRYVIQQRKWAAEGRKKWMQSLAGAARIWRWTPAAQGETNSP